MLIHALPMRGQGGLASMRWFNRTRSKGYAVAHGHKRYDAHGQIPDDDMAWVVHPDLIEHMDAEKEHGDK